MPTKREADYLGVDIGVKVYAEKAGKACSFVVPTGVLCELAGDPHPLDLRALQELYVRHRLRILRAVDRLFEHTPAGIERRLSREDIADV